MLIIPSHLMSHLMSQLLMQHRNSVGMEPHLPSPVITLLIILTSTLTILITPKGLKASFLIPTPMVIPTTPLLERCIMDSKVTPCNSPLVLPLLVDILPSLITCPLKLVPLLIPNMLPV